MTTYTDEDRRELEAFLGNGGEAAPETQTQEGEAEAPAEENTAADEPVEVGDDAQDDGEESYVIKLGDEVLTPQDDAEDAGAPSFVKDLRQAHREQVKRNRELEERLRELESKLSAGQPAQNVGAISDPGPMPRIDDEDIAYNPDLHAEKVEQWFEQKRRFDELKAHREAQQKAAEEARRRVEGAFSEQRERLRKAIPTYDLVEQKVTEKLTQPQQAALKVAALNADAGALIYAVGSKPQLLEKLAAVQDPALFLIELGKLAATTKVEPVKRKPTATPVPDIKGGGADGMAGLVSKYEKADPLERMKMRKANPQIHQAWLSR